MMGVGMNEQTRILVVEDDLALREAMCETLAYAGYPATGAVDGSDALDKISKDEFSLVISDVQMDGMDGHRLLESVKKSKPELPFVLVTAYGSIEQAVNAIQHGAADYLTKPFEAQVLVEVASRFACPLRSHSGLLAEDEKTQDALRLAERVAGSDATVMITGESGTGKEVFARYIHQHSGRSEAPFVAINCAAIPETMLESILFGYEKGAFTGAYRSRAGKFEQAHRGTLLLDEISEMDISLQAKLLRVLQEKEVEPLGGSSNIALDVRVLATTNRNLRELVGRGEFREDLYYRLNVFPLNLPALRYRRADILPLADYFVANIASDEHVCISAQAKEKLLQHEWPGNVRELENVMQRALILRVGNTLRAADICFEESDLFEAGVKTPTSAEETVADTGSLEDDLRAREQILILDALKAEGGSKQGAAERLGISPRTLRYKLARFRKDGVSSETINA
jgi:two-component system, response regulator FlrC